MYYKILYIIRETMRRHQSAVVWDDEAGKMVDAVFASLPEAEAAGHAWFDGSWETTDKCDHWYIKSYRK